MRDTISDAKKNLTNLSEETKISDKKNDNKIEGNLKKTVTKLN